VEQNLQGHELLDSLDQLRTKQELNDDPNTNYTMKCPAGSKSYYATCVRDTLAVRAKLKDSICKSLSQVRARVMNRGGAA
jgi:hypothetical protein